jgi:hypothetical protein
MFIFLRTDQVILNVGSMMDKKTETWLLSTANLTGVTKPEWSGTSVALIKKMSYYRGLKFVS